MWHNDMDFVTEELWRLQARRGYLGTSLQRPRPARRPAGRRRQPDSLATVLSWVPELHLPPNPQKSKSYSSQTRK